MTDANSIAQSKWSSRAGITYMCLGVFFMVSLDVTVRWLLERYSLMQVAFLRSTFSILLILVFTVVRGQFPRLRTRRVGWHITRSLLTAGAMLSFFHALRFIPLADIVIFAFAAPLIITALSNPLLGEVVGPWRWAAIIVGFIGVLVVLRPGSGAVHPAALYALVAAGLYAGLALTTRKLSATETTLSLTLYLYVAPWLIAGAGSLASWRSPDLSGWLTFGVCGAFGALGIAFINVAYQRTAVAIVVPFEYTALIWAAVAGFVFWGEIPDRSAWVGAAILTASGLFILYRETRAPSGSDAGQPNFPLQEATGAPPDEMR